MRAVLWAALGALLCEAVLDDTYYRTLGVSTDASTLQVKKAYRRLALRWHPDKNPQDPEGAAEKFRAVANAYEVLGNAALRRVYDVNGLGASGGHAGAERQPQQHHPRNFSSFRFRSADEIFKEFFGDSEDPFADFFDGDDGGGGEGGDMFGRVPAMKPRAPGEKRVTTTTRKTRTTTVDGQQRSFVESHSTKDHKGRVVTKKVSQHNREDGREVRTAEIEERKADGARRREMRQMVDGEYVAYSDRNRPRDDF